MYLVSDLLIPRIAAAQLALVEPDFDTGGAQGLANLLCRLRVLRGIAEKYRVRLLSHGRATPGSEVFSQPPMGQLIPMR